MPSGLSRSETEALVRGIMEVDVGDGCREGRLAFIQEHLGSDWAKWAEALDRQVEVYLLIVTHRSDNSYNSISDPELAEYIHKQASDAGGECEVLKQRIDIDSSTDADELLRILSKTVKEYEP